MNFTREQVKSPVTTVLADGMACRVPEPGALDALMREADDVVAEAMRRRAAPHR